MEESAKERREREEREKQERLFQLQLAATLREWDRIRNGRPDRECVFFKGCLSLRENVILGESKNGCPAVS